MDSSCDRAVGRPSDAELMAAAEGSTGAAGGVGVGGNMVSLCAISGATIDDENTEVDLSPGSGQERKPRFFSLDSQINRSPQVSRRPLPILAVLLHTLCDSPSSSSSSSSLSPHHPSFFPLARTVPPPSAVAPHCAVIARDIVVWHRRRKGWRRVALTVRWALRGNVDSRSGPSLLDGSAHARWEVDRRKRHARVALHARLLRLRPAPRRRRSKRSARAKRCAAAHLATHRTNRRRRRPCHRAQLLSVALIRRPWRDCQARCRCTLHRAPSALVRCH